MKDDSTLILVGGGLVLLYLMMKNSPSAVAAQNEALATSAGLESQAINANANARNISAIAGGAQGIVSALTGQPAGVNGPVSYYN